MKTLRIIGDVHGNVHQYYDLIQEANFSIQVGDFGFKSHLDWLKDNVNPSYHRVIRGNHDYYGKGYEDPLHSLTSIDEGCKLFEYQNHEGHYHNIFSVRGAMSIDKSMRTLGRDYFEEEELNWQQSNNIIDYYQNLKDAGESIDIMISHDCPQFVREQAFGIGDKSNTASLLETLYNINPPRLWLFGHYHKSMTLVHESTTFECLPELGCYDIIVQDVIF